jgi:transcriptional regulator with XRE-family HTH domain
MSRLNAEVRDGKSKSDIARDLGTSVAAVHRWMSGERGAENARLIDAIRLCQYLRIDRAQLQGQLSMDEARVFALLQELSTDQGGLIQLPLISQHMDGLGMWQENREIHMGLAFHTDWLFQSLGRRNRNTLELVEVAGDAMEPTIMDGDTAMVDTSDTDIRSGKLYCLELDGQIIAARLRPERGQLLATYDNPGAEPEVLDLGGSASIRGRIVWVSRTL